MEKQTLLITTNQFTVDSYISEMMEYQSRKDQFNILDLEWKEKKEIENSIIKNLLGSFSDVGYDYYNSISNYSQRCGIIQRAIKNKELSVKKIIKDDFKALTTAYLNVFEIDKHLFGNFVDYFAEDIFIGWHSISKENALGWNKDILEKGKLVWDWFEIQLNPSLSKYFVDFKLLTKYQHFLNWDIISSDERLKWDSEKILLFEKKIRFSRIWNERLNNKSGVSFILKCFINNGHTCGVSFNPHLSKETILRHIKLWDWEYLSSNPALLIDDFFLKNHLNDINLYGLSHNKGLSLSNLKFLKDLNLTIDKSSNKQRIIYKAAEINWSFVWLYAFENASVDWDLENIEDFIPILNERSSHGGYNWWGISKNLKNKSVILKYKDQVEFFGLVYNNPEIIWDSELTQLLIHSGISLNINSFSKGLPDLFQQINITKDAIFAHKDFWHTKYKYSYSLWHGDEKEEIENYYPIWDKLKENKNIVWDEELIELGKIYD